MTLLTEIPAMHGFTQALQRAHELSAQSFDAWQSFTRMLEEFDHLSVDESMGALEQVSADRSLQPLAQTLSRRATERFPEHWRGWFFLGRNLLLGNQHSPDAYIALERAWELSPESRSEFAVCLSAAYLAVKRWSDAERVCRQVLEWQADCADAYSNLSIAQRRQFRPEAAVEAARRALHCHPEHHHAPSNLVLALNDACQFEKALAAVREYLARHPDDARLRLLMGELELRLGQWDRGWNDMDARFAVIPKLGAQLDARERLLGVPRWQGQSLADKTLGVWLEQGYGDAILLIRFLPRFVETVRQHGGKLVFGCFGPLAELFRSIIPDDVEVDVDCLRPTDYHLPLMSACGAFGITEADVCATPYIQACAKEVSDWRSLLKRDARLHIALAWTGNPQQIRNDFRSLDLTSLRQLLDQEGVLFHSVNPEVAQVVSELAAWGLPIVDQSAALDSFADTAAFLKAVDAVVSTCTSTVHLAGALGVPTLLLLDKVGSFLWRRDTHRTPWYDSVRILRQRKLGEWGPVLQRLRQHLATQARTKAKRRP
jgi:tetratricopeptide (TPR) repeat protein